MQARHAVAKTPAYAIVAEALKRRILDGPLDPGQKLPSEHQLMGSFSVSRVTVRRALGQLRAEGLVESRQGSGNFVCAPKAVQNLCRLQGLAEEMARSGYRTRSTVVSMGPCRADAAVAAALDLAVGDEVFQLRRVRHVNMRPVSFDVSYFPKVHGMRLATHDLENEDVFVVLESELGIELGVAELTIEVESARPSLARRLEMAPGAPVLALRRLTRDCEGRPIDFEYLFGRADRLRLEARVPRW